MDRFEAFFHMGGYAAFVWPAYGLAAVVMLGLVTSSVLRLRRNQQRLRDMESHRGPQAGGGDKD